MRVVTRRTGLSAELLRVWERRYRVVTPARTQTGRRLYSDSEIERLRLLHRATLGGRSIGLIAALSTSALVELLRQDTSADPARAEDGKAVRRAAADADGPARMVIECLRAVERFDPVVLEALLRRAGLALPATVFLEHVVSPVLEQVRIRWRDETLGAAHGHLATGVVRRVLEQSIVPAASSSPRLLLASVTGQAHELGGLIAAVAAAADGWSVTWLAGSLSVEDIAEAAKKRRVRAVGLSVLHSPADVGVSDEVRRLRSLLTRSTQLLVGGDASNIEVLDEIGAVPVTDMTALTSTLRNIATRSRARKRAGAKR